MFRSAAVPSRLWRGRWTPFRLIVLGAFLGLLSALADAGVTLASNLGFLHGILDAVPYALVLLDEALIGVAGPVGLFLVLCGLALHLRSYRPPGRSRSFRVALGGAGLGLAAGLLLGVVHLSVDLLPPEMFTVGLVEDLVLVLFAGAVAAGVGLFAALCGLAGLAREAQVEQAGPPGNGLRLRRGKSIYRAVPSGR